MALRVLIADDEPNARERLREFLSKETNIEVVAECGDGRSALHAIRKTAPDLVFLDVQMPELTAFEIIAQLSPNPIPTIILVTAHPRYAMEAFDVSAVDYLLKPFDHSRFQRALSLGRERVAARTRSQQTLRVREKTGPSVYKRKEDRLIVRSSGRIIPLACSEISWISSAGNYAEIHVGKAVHLLRQTLTSLEDSLPADFVRVSKSCLVNMKFIRELNPKLYGDALVILVDGTQLTATRNYRQHLRSKLKGWGRS